MSDAEHPESKTDIGEMPEPSAEIVLIRVAISAFLATTSEKRAEAFLRHMAETLADEESLAAISPIRRATHARSVSKARRGAVAMFDALLPTFQAYVKRK
jgi:hypothetical protein